MYTPRIKGVKVITLDFIKKALATMKKEEKKDEYNIQDWVRVYHGRHWIEIYKEELECIAMHIHKKIPYVLMVRNNYGWMMKSGIMIAGCHEFSPSEAKKYWNPKSPKIDEEYSQEGYKPDKAKYAAACFFEKMLNAAQTKKKRTTRSSRNKK